MPYLLTSNMSMKILVPGTPGIELYVPVITETVVPRNDNVAGSCA
jgi:hypothetical protein